MRPRALAHALALAGAGMLLTACGGDTAPGQDEEQVDAVEAPELGACRELSLDDIAQASNATEVVDCDQTHNAETYAVGQLPAEFDDSDDDTAELNAFAYRTCTEKFVKFLGGDESTAMRSVLTWAWFRPSEKAWDDGARWYRCDLVGGGEQSAELVDLPTTAKGLLNRPDDRWMVCASGDSVAGSVKAPCTEPHDWRAISTVKLGEAGDDYPGDRLVEVKSRDFCSDQVGAWLQYPVDYDYGYTWFHEAEWQAGNRRSVCWAKTDQ